MTEHIGSPGDGIGGGVIIPFCVAIFRLPVRTIAGAALAGTLFTSVAGVILYSVLPAPPGVSTHPGLGLGGTVRSGRRGRDVFGARCQRFVLQQALEGVLGLLLTSLAVQYVTSFRG